MSMHNEHFYQRLAIYSTNIDGALETIRDVLDIPCNLIDIPLEPYPALRQFGAEDRAKLVAVQNSFDDEWARVMAELAE
jgi:hypothetical protein